MRQHLRRTGRGLRFAVLAVAVLAAACTSRSDRRPTVQIEGTDPSGVSTARTPGATSVPTAPNADGIISYDGYQAAVAREGETVAMLADRVGLSASSLGAYNGLTPTHRLRAGDELVLPPQPARAAPAPSSITAPAPSPSRIEQTPLSQAGSSGTTSSSDGWSPALAEAAIERSTGLNEDGSLAAPPSSTDPVPPEPEPRRNLESPDLGQYQTGPIEARPQPRPGPDTAIRDDDQVAAATPTAPAPNLRLLKPVQGPVAIGFNKGAGPARNDGVDFAAPAGSPVVAAAEGEVALVSQSLGGLGTIVLLRHADEILTVYGRVDDVSVSKGDRVSRGQQIGVVSNAAAPSEPRMHFEVRRGAESLDPMLFL